MRSTGCFGGSTDSRFRSMETADVDAEGEVASSASTSASSTFSRRSLAAGDSLWRELEDGKSSEEEEGVEARRGRGGSWSRNESVLSNEYVQGEDLTGRTRFASTSTKDLLRLPSAGKGGIIDALNGGLRRGIFIAETVIVLSDQAD
jgi:hypothetical protein